MGSKTFCIMPFIHLQIKPDGQIKPCCRFEFNDPEYKKEAGGYAFDEFNVDKKDLPNVLKDPLWEKIRDKMLKGEKVSGCRRCYQEEEIGTHSMRFYMNFLWNERNQIELVKDISLRYIEMTFGNYCNLKCRTCNSDLSSTWNDDENYLAETGKYSDRKKRIKIKSVSNIWKPEHFINVEEIKFTGGEPMLHPDFIGFLDMLIDNDLAKNITLDVFTNCSWIPKEKHFARFEKFKKNQISLSIDGVEKINDYIRNPSKWEVVDLAAKEWIDIELKHLDRFEIVWHPTVNIYNCLDLDNMVLWWLNLHRKDFRYLVHKTKFNFLTYPVYLSVGLLSEEAKRHCIQKMQDLIDHPLVKTMDDPNKKLDLKLNELKNKIETSSTEERFYRLFLEYTKDLDKLRDEKFKDSIPELYQYFSAGFENAQ
jgi:organic radical activating enzyme